MNKVQQFWNEFCVTNHKEGNEYKDAFQFGASADWLADLVVEGKKTATTSGFVFYELEKEDIPQAGEYYIVLSGQEEPVAVIQEKEYWVIRDKAGNCVAIHEDPPGICRPCG